MINQKLILALEQDFNDLKNKVYNKARTPEIFKASVLVIRSCNVILKALGDKGTYASDVPDDPKPKHHMSHLVLRIRDHNIMKIKKSAKGGTIFTKDISEKFDYKKAKERVDAVDKELMPQIREEYTHFEKNKELNMSKYEQRKQRWAAMNYIQEKGGDKALKQTLDAMKK